MLGMGEAEDLPEVRIFRNVDMAPVEPDADKRIVVAATHALRAEQDMALPVFARDDEGANFGSATPDEGGQAFQDRAQMVWLAKRFA